MTCFVTRVGFRRWGVSGALAAAAVDFAGERGARAIEGYPMLTLPGQQITWGELYVGSRSVVEDAGFAEVSRPTRRRIVMRIDFWPESSEQHDCSGADGFPWRTTRGPATGGAPRR
ncbi:MAG: hypothetical protein WA890_31555 [Micromonospora sp.]